MTSKQPDPLQDFLVVGQSYSLFFNEGNPNNKTIEIRGFVDDYIVWLFRNSDGDLKYRFDHRYFFEGLIRDNQIKPHQ